MIKILGAFLISALISCVLGPIIIKLSRRLRAEQPILGYVENHNVKAGTPTMGGIIFVLASGITSIIFLPFGKEGTVCLAIMLAFALIGFLDDYIKVRFKKNMGLRPYQKIIGQSAVSLILALYADRITSGSLQLPFTDHTISVGAFSIPLYFLATIATTNAVNLTDGLDGLASVTSVVALTALVVTCVLAGQWQLAIFSVTVVGALAAFLVMNCFPAKIFMGDTGSLALGGALSAVAILSEKILFLPVIGLPFVVSALSVIIQVVYFKLSGGKRVFKMAPFHHHLERMGIHENKITFAYGLVSVVSCALVIMMI